MPPVSLTIPPGRRNRLAGWLTPQLLPLGVVPTIIITGVIWGLWHTPVLLLGHNYPQLPGWQSVLFMVIFSTLIGGLFAWLAIRTNSVWPAALGHSTLNATGGLPLLFSADTTFDTAHVGITGTTGWLVAAVILLVLIITRSFKPARYRASARNGLAERCLKIKLQPLTKRRKPAENARA